ncbi:hypothetical protein AN958_12604 [Leucoagaricus sp. SymC.cos]|nr:hypothetical protein AN958_12604 [Leucoagaricus sp. SymC.cos]
MDLCWLLLTWSKAGKFVEALLDAFSRGIGGEYDIGCKFGTMLNTSRLGEEARRLHYTALINLFHGHAHNWLCQLTNLLTYVKGMGLEDLEGCECFFSKSNVLVASIHHASVFHRKQKIVEFIQHMDSFETSQSLSNYRQALEVLKTEPALKEAMSKHSVSDSTVFVTWLKEEHEYLLGLSSEPFEETLQMEYYQKLVNLKKYNDKVAAISAEWVVLVESDPQTSKSPDTCPICMRHARENQTKAREVVQQLEVQLKIQTRWTPDMPKYQKAAELVSKRHYQ